MATTRGQGDGSTPPTKAEQAESLARSAIAGHPQGATRRILLYAGALLAIGLGMFGFTPFLLVSLVCFALLLSTDGGL